MVPTFDSRTLSPRRRRWPIWKTSRTRARLVVVVPRTWDCHYQRAAALSTTGKPSRRETHCSIPCDMRNMFVPCASQEQKLCTTTTSWTVGRAITGPPPGPFFQSRGVGLRNSRQPRPAHVLRRGGGIYWPTCQDRRLPPVISRVWLVGALGLLA